MLITALAFLATFSWLILIAQIARSIAGRRRLFLLAPASLIAAGMSAPSLWIALSNMYPYDSFFSLKTGGRLGVLLISTLLITLFFALLTVKTRWVLSARKNPEPNILAASVLGGLDCMAGILIFGVLIALSPQVYYTLYYFIFPNLPIQIVVKNLFDVNNLVELAHLSADGSLSSHLSGLVLLAIIPYTSWLHLEVRGISRQSLIAWTFVISTTLVTTHIFSKIYVETLISRLVFADEKLMF